MTLTPIISNLFGRSPIKPLEHHIDKAHACVELLQPFFEAVMSQQWDTAANLQQEIAILEKEADNLKRDLRLHLPKGLFLPVSRTDILDLVTVQDHLANCAQDIAGVVIGRKLQLPESMSESFIRYLNKCVSASRQARKAINELDELLESGFRGNEVKIIENMINDLNTIEHETDEMQINVRHQLFELENTLPPVDVIFMYQLIELIGQLADKAQTVGARLQILLAR